MSAPPAVDGCEGGWVHSAPQGSTLSRIDPRPHVLSKPGRTRGPRQSPGHPPAPRFQPEVRVTLSSPGGRSRDVAFGRSIHVSSRGFMRYSLRARAVASLGLALTLGACAASAVPNATFRATAPPATTAPSTSTPAAAGVITGTIVFNAGFIPAMTVYAVSVVDQRAFSVERAHFAEGQGPSDRATYSITGVAPGTYYVLAWRNSDLPARDQPGLYSQFVVRCVQPSLAGASLLPECNNMRTGDHSLIPVTVRPGETVARIDVGDWSYEQASYPPRPAR